MRARYGRFASAMCAAALLLLGCSGGTAAPATVIEAGMQDLAFAPSTFTLRKDEAVRLDFLNNGSQVHDFTVEKMPVSGVHTAGNKAPAEHNMRDMGMDTYALHLAVAAGKRAQIDFRPTQAGDYEFYCAVAGHRDAGMRGTIHVE